MSLFLRLENLRGKYQDICNLLSNAAAKKKVERNIGAPVVCCPLLVIPEQTLINFPQQRRLRVRELSVREARYIWAVSEKGSNSIPCSSSTLIFPSALLTF